MGKISLQRSSFPPWVTGNSILTLSVAWVKSLCRLLEGIDQLPSDPSSNLNTLRNPPGCGCQHGDVQSWSWISASTSSEKRPEFEEQRLDESNSVLYSKPCLTWYLVSFRVRLFSSVGCWTLCHPSPSNWLFLVQIRSSAITYISQNLPRSDSLQQTSLSHWNKAEFCQGFQWSQDFTPKIFSVFWYAKAI